MTKYLGISTLVHESNLKRIMIFLMLSSIAAANDWPEFRGVNGSGVIPDANLPITWSTTKNVTWKVMIPGKGWSSPVVYDEKVFVTAATEDHKGDPRALRVVCLDAQTGKIDWDKKVLSPQGEGIKHPKNSHSSSTPLVRDGRIYAHFAHMGTACLKLDGEILWAMNHLKYEPKHGTGSSPVLVGDHLIFNCDADDDPFIAAVHKDSGKVAWTTRRSKTRATNKFSFSTPVVIDVGEKQQVVSPGSGAVWGYDPANGQELWRVDYGLGFSVTPRPVYGNGLVYVSSGHGDKGLYAIRPGGKGNVTATHIKWKLERNGPVTPTPLLVGSELYIVRDNGDILCLDAITGKVHWQDEIKGVYSSSPVCGGGRIYIASEKGIFTVFKVGKEFEILAENDMKEKTYATPAIIDDALIIRTEAMLYRID